MFKNGKLIKVKTLDKGKTKLKAIAGARATSCCVGAWGENWAESAWDAYDSASNWWNSGGEDCLTDSETVASALSMIGASTGCAASIASDFASAGLTTAAVVGSCTGASGAAISFYNALDDTGCF